MRARNKFPVNDGFQALKFKLVSVTYFICALSRVKILKLNYAYCVWNICLIFC